MRMKWLKRVSIAVGTLLLVVLLAAWWLLASSAGLRFAVARVQAATGGALQIRQADGSLLGPLTLHGVHYHDADGLDVRVVSAQAKVRFWPLLAKRLHVTALDVEGVDVVLPASSEQPPAESPSSFSLAPPIAIFLDHAHIGTIKISQHDQAVFAADNLDLGGRWTHAGIALTQLALRGPDGHADISGQLGIGKRYRGDGKATFTWKFDDTEYAGSLVARSDGSLTHATVELTKPAAAHLQLQLKQRGKFPWTASLNVPAFNPAVLIGDSAIKKLAANVQGSGNRDGGSVHGKLDVNDYALTLQPLRTHFSNDLQTLTIDELVLTADQIKGKLQATGVVKLDARPVSATLSAQWQNVELPADLAGQILASHGQISAHGSVQEFHVEGKVSLGPPGKLAALNVDLDGTPQVITLHTLALAQAQGGMQAHGTLTLQPALAWDLEATADKLDPGQLFAGWNGAVDFDLGSTGTATPEGPDAQIDIHKLSGTLRQRALRGDGKLHITPRKIVDGHLQLSAGDSQVQINAKPGSSNNIDVDLAIASLNDWLPGTGGRINGRFQVRGMVPSLSVQGHVDGHKLSWHEQRINTLALTMDVPDINHPGGKLAVDAREVQAAALTLETLKLQANGNQARHQVTLDAAGPQATLALALDGAFTGKTWRGTLTTLNLTPEGLPAWHLQDPAQLSWNKGAASLSALCLSAGDPSLCITAARDPQGALDASYKLHDVPLALLLTASGSALPMRADGTLQGRGTVQRNAAGALSGRAEVTSSQGSITYIDQPDEPVLTYKDFTATANLEGGNQRLKASATLDEGGSVDANLTIHGAQQTLTGAIDLDLPTLNIVNLLTTELAAVKGSIKGHFEFAGNVAKPVITGQASVDGLSAEVPAAGITLHEGHLTLSTRDTDQWQVTGSVQSGKGQLTIAGVAGIDPDQPTAITIKGNAFAAANIPAAKVVVSPDLAIHRDAKGLSIDGTLAIDSADVDVSKLPGAGATQASPDIVVIDEEQQQRAAALPVNAKVRVDLGEHTHVRGLGLDGRVAGILNVSERPGHETLGQGQLSIDGTYRAYGQDLHIERGQLLFASTPIGNPALNIRATRSLNPNATIDGGNKVGLDVSGTAQRPILTVFSNPVMEQSDALSYLVTGKPLSQVKGGEGNLVGAAAQALGSAAGDLLAKSIGSRVGADVGVSSSEALGGSAALTVGKFLSPRLYLSYGVGLFEPGEVVTLRYILNKRWNFEALNATTFSRMMFNYRLER